MVIWYYNWSENDEQDFHNRVCFINFVRLLHENIHAKTQGAIEAGSELPEMWPLRVGLWGLSRCKKGRKSGKIRNSWK